MSEIVQMADNPAVFDLDSQLQGSLASLQSDSSLDSLQLASGWLAQSIQDEANPTPVVPCQITRLRAQVAALEITNAGLLEEIALLRAQLEPPPPAQPAKPNPLHRALARHARPSSHFDRRLPWGD